MGDRARPASVPYGEGYPAALTDLTRVVPFNDADALERAARRGRGSPA